MKLITPTGCGTTILAGKRIEMGWLVSNQATPRHTRAGRCCNVATAIFDANSSYFAGASPAAGTGGGAGDSIDGAVGAITEASDGGGAVPLCGTEVPAEGGTGTVPAGVNWVVSPAG